jgi:DNA recombination-dependent growth factor C
MNYAELGIIALLALSLVIQVLLARSLANIFRQGVDHLDNSLAAALESTLSNLPESLGSLADLAPEPINPIQALVMEMIQSRMKPPTLEVKEISRSSDGKFS